MSSFCSTGLTMKINKIFKKIKLGSCTYEWEIDCFSYFSREPKSMLVSPSFMIPNTKIDMCLNLYPGGFSDKHSGNVSIFLRPARNNLSPVIPEIEGNMQVLLKKNEKSFFCFSKTTDVGNFEKTSPGFFKLMDHDRLREVLRVNNDKLHIVCNVSVFQKVHVLDNPTKKLPVVTLKRLGNDYGAYDMISKKKIVKNLSMDVISPHVIVHTTKIRC